MIKVLYDHQTFSLQDYGGISKIFTELLSKSTDYDVACDLATIFSNNIYLENFKLSDVYRFLKSSNFKHKHRIMYAINKAYSVSKLKAGEFDIFHPTYYDPYFLKYLKRKPFVITYHDLTHEKFADRYPSLSNDRLILEGKKLLINHANKIIAVSNSTKNDLIKLYGIDADMIEVIYLGSSLQIRSKAANDRLVKEQYILYVGIRSQYKNFIFFLNAIASVLNSDRKLKLVCAGGGAFTENETEQINGLNLQDKVQHYPIKNNDILQNLYANAVCFIFPSLDEGFGIPLLEAFSCGCPAAASNRASLPEVGGDAVVYFDPEDAQSIAETAVRLIDDGNLRKDKILKGYNRLSSFSWDVTRKKTFLLYQSLLL